jgi:hypothetical protein
MARFPTKILHYFSLLLLPHNHSRFPYHTNTAFGTATPYALDGPEIEIRWGTDFPHPSRPAPGVHPASYTMGTGSLSRGYSGRSVVLTTHPIQGWDFKERVPLYLYAPSGPSWQVMG